MKISQRFRGFLPVVVDVETGGFNPNRDALLEAAFVFIDYDDLRVGKGLQQNTITLSHSKTQT